MDDLGRRPETTCAFKMKKARKNHRCSDCQARIERGLLYVQDEYYAPFGNGRRFCLGCAKERKEEESQWIVRHTP